MRISYRQAELSLKKANPNRRMEKESIEFFQTQMGEIIDLVAEVVESTMPQATKGRGSMLNAKQIETQLLVVELELMKELVSRLRYSRGDIE